MDWRGFIYNCQFGYFRTASIYVNYSVMASENASAECSQTIEVNTCVLEATVVTGFEGVAKEECLEKLGVHGRSERGRIFFELNTDRAHEALKLRGVDNVLVVVKDFPNFSLAVEKEEVFAQFRKLPYEIDWLPSLTVWKDLTNFHMSIEEITKFMGQCHIDKSPEKNNDSDKAQSGNCSTSVVSNEVTHSNQKEPAVVNGSPDFKQKVSKSTVPRFRVSCNRSGKKHYFSSQEAACQFGGAVQDYFQWQADMKNHDVHVVLTINEQRVYLCLAVTKESLHNRNLEHFGPTSLRSTIAHNMLRMCGIRVGDIVCDPMCGGGSLPIEGSLCWPKSYFICGDNHELAWARTLQNLEALSTNPQNTGCKPVIDVQKWDARNLPLKDSSVDIIVTDLPFGKRMGSRTDNRILYPQVLREMARVCRIGKGKAVLLTQDRQSLTKAITNQSNIWWQKRVLAVNIGGLAASVYVLQRTNRPQGKYWCHDKTSAKTESPTEDCEKAK